jgi:hypothetical protein
MTEIEKYLRMDRIIMTTVKERKPNDTDKSKESLAPELGYSLKKLEMLTIAWAPAPLDAEQKALIRAVAEARSTVEMPISTRRVMHDLVMEALALKTPEFQKEAAAVLALKAKDETEESLTKELEAMQRRMQKTQEMLNLKRAALKK